MVLGLEEVRMRVIGCVYVAVCAFWVVPPSLSFWAAGAWRSASWW